MLACQVFLKGRLTNVVLCYRPHFDDPVATGEIVTELRKYVDQEIPFLFLGDFNFPGVDWDLLRDTPPISRSTTRFIDFCLDSVIHQLVREFAHFRGNETFVLDLIFTRFSHEVRDITVDAPPGKSGHVSLRFKYGRERAPQPLPSVRRIYIRAAKHQLMEHARHMNWNGGSEECRGSVGVICSNIRELEEQYVPVKRISSSAKPRWFRPRVARAMRAKA